MGLWWGEQWLRIQYLSDGTKQHDKKSHKQTSGFEKFVAPIAKLPQWSWPVAVGLVIVLLLGIRLPEISLRDDREAMQYLESVAAQLPERSILISTQDAETFALWYGVWASGELLPQHGNKGSAPAANASLNRAGAGQTGVAQAGQATIEPVLINQSLLQFGWYQRLIQERYHFLPSIREPLPTLLKANLETHTVFLTEEGSIDPNATLSPTGPALAIFGGVRAKRPIWYTLATMINSAKIRPILWTLLGVLILFVGFKTFQLVSAGWALYGELQALEGTLTSDLDQPSRPDLAAIDFADLAPKVDSMASRFDDVEQAFGFFTPLLSRLGWLPKWGPTLAAAPALLSSATHSTHLAADALSAVAPALEVANANPMSEPIALLEALADSPDMVDSMSQRSEELVQNLSHLQAGALHPLLGGPLEDVQPYLPLLPSLLRMTPSLPTLLGQEEPKHYLIMVQNNHELRATGGFMTAIGTVDVEDGQIGELKFQDIYKFEPNGNAMPPAPQPMQRYMGLPIMTLRDANWSPDLPTTAQTIKAFYTQATGLQVDGIVTVDLRAADLLVHALAPLSIEGADDPVTGETLLTQILDFWQSPLDSDISLEEESVGKWWGQRKDFMPKLAAAALAKNPEW